MNATGRATPGRFWVNGCECQEVIIDYPTDSVFHLFYKCPFYGQVTPLEATDEIGG